MWRTISDDASRSESRRGHAGNRGRPRERRLAIERLESRRVLTGWHWAFNDGPGAVTIRETTGQGPDLSVITSNPDAAWTVCPHVESLRVDYSLRTGPDTLASGPLFGLSSVESLAFWIKPQATLAAGAAPSVLVELPSSGPADMLAFGEWSGAFDGESFSLIDQYEDGWRGTAITDVQFPAGTWTHVALVWNSGENHYDFFVNGNKVPVIPNSKGHAAKLMSPTGIHIGQRSVLADPLPFSGQIDALYISDHAWTLDEVRARSEAHIHCAEVTSSPTAPRNTLIPLSLNDGASPSTTYEIVRFPAHGALVSGESSAFLTYHPSPDFIGRDYFTYRSFDGADYGEVRAVVITIAPDHTPSLSYYVPGVATINAEIGVQAQRNLVGAAFPYDLIVNQQLGDVVERLDTQGNVVWRLSNPGRYTSVDTFGEEVILSNGNQVLFLDVHSGDLRRDWRLEDTAIIEFVNQIDTDRFIVYRTDFNARSHLELWSLEQGRLWEGPPTLFARWAELSGDLVAIADTFNHRVLGVNIATNSTVFELEAYYPNDVRFVSGEEILITEEHADRIWTYNWQTREKKLVFAAPGARQDLGLSLSEVIALSESADLRIVPTSDTSKSRASVEYAGRSTVYAPNGALSLPDGSFYIADTDNHRVLHVSAAGLLLGEIVGFNNPTKIAIMPAIEAAVPQPQVSAEPVVAVSFSVTNLAGQPVTDLSVGEEFLLVASVADTRLNASGVFAAYLDVHYSEPLADIIGTPLFSDDYPHSREGDTTTAGVIDEVGAYANLSPLGPGPRRLFSIAMRATAPGELSFWGDPADLRAVHDVLLYGVEQPVSSQAIDFGITTVLVHGPASSHDDHFTVSEDSGPHTWNVLANDQIRLPATIVQVSAPAHGTATIAASSNLVVYTPAANFFGVDTFTYQVRDALGRNTSAQVSVQVNPTNDPPTALPDVFTVFGDSPRAMLPVLANDSASPDENEQLFVAFVSQPPVGGRVQLINGQVWFTPDAGFYGDARFTYVAGDGNGGSALADVLVHVQRRWTNPDNRYDVNRDGDVSPMDALVVINYLNQHGPGVLPVTSSAAASTNSLIDVDGDGVASPMDVLMLINELERRAAARRGGGAEGEYGDHDAALLEWLSEPSAMFHELESTATLLGGYRAGPAGYDLDRPPSGRPPVSGGGGSVTTDDSFGCFVFSPRSPSALNPRDCAAAVVDELADLLYECGGDSTDP